MSKQIQSALLRMHLAVFIWGFTGVLGKAISLKEGWLVWWRLLITAVSLWILFYFFGWIKKVTTKQFLKLSLIGTILALHWLCFYGSIKYSNVSVALTCLATSGLFSAIVEPVFFRKKINIAELLLGLFALAGIAIIYVSNLDFSIGIYVGILSSLLTVLASVMNKKLVDGYEPKTICLYQLTGGFLGLTVLIPFYNYILPAEVLVPVGYDWLWLIVLSWLCTIFTFFLSIFALKRLSAFTMNLLLTLEPVYGIILAFAIFNESKDLSEYFYIGFGLILLAVVLQMRRLTKKTKPLTN
jgi:drug/metabolite transporter (DMT)-like permease